MRVEIAVRAHVRQSNDGPASDGFGQLARGHDTTVVAVATGVFLLFHSVIRGSDVPERVVRPGVVAKRDDLLARTSAQLLFFRIQIVARIFLLNFNGRSARDIIIVAGGGCILLVHHTR